jgi:membrane protease YdiL (CAAX protease family)
MSTPPPSWLPPRPPELPDGVERPQPPERRPWELAVPLWAPFVIALAVFVLAGVAYAVIVAAAGLSAAEAENAPGPLLGATFVQDALLVVGAFYVVHRASNSDPATALGIRRTKVWPAVGWACAVLAAFWLVTSILIAAFGEPPEQEITEEIKAESAAVAIAGYIAITCLLAPIAEETFFRGLLFPMLKSRWGTVAGVLVTGAIFSLVHASGSPLQALIVLFVLGAGLCLLYLRTGSLLPCIGLHALNNAIAFAVTKEMEWPVALVTVVGSVVVSMAIALMLVRSHEAG